MSANNNNNSSAISNRCTTFKAHQLKPDKCKNCFADKSKHQQGPEVEEVTGDTGQQASQDAPHSSSSTRDDDEDNKDKLIESYKKEIAKLREDLRAAQQQQQQQQQDSGKTCEQCRSSQGQLDSCRSQCQSLECERDQLKEELRAMEREMEEMHDTFKEEESEQFEQTKQELDLAMKNCKILQIRLHKAERQYGQLEQVKSMLEQQLEESNNQRLQQVEQQPAAGQQQQSINFTQIGNDSVKLSTGEYDKLLKDLSDTFEREKDLQEQIKYSQEEAQLKSDRLQSVEAENEILLNKVSKLTLANSRLRAQASSQVQSANDQASMTTMSDIREATEEKGQLIEENEQLKLALEFAQSECDRLKNKLQESQSKLDSLKNALQLSESNRLELDTELNRLKLRRQASFERAGGSLELEDPKAADQVSKLELECRQLRSKLVHSERENRQLKAQSMSMVNSSYRKTTRAADPFASLAARGIMPKSHSMDMTAPPGALSNGSEQARYRELNRQLREQCDSLREQNEQLEQRLEDLTLSLSAEAAGGDQSNMESDLLEKLKRRLDFSESELAKVRSRLVEMDLECSRVQRQHRRLVESLENSSSDAAGLLINRRKVKLPPESVRDSMSRQELRQAVRDLDEELDECMALLRAKDCLITERASEAANSQQHESANTTISTCEEQVKSLRRLLEQERLLSNNLKIDVSSLEETRQELMTNTMMLERERVSMEEELDKLRSLNMELNTDNEDLKRTNRSQSNRLKDLQVNYEKVRAEVLKLQQQQQQQQQRQKRESSSSSPGTTTSGEANDLLLMARDLSELKVKNGFLMRQLEIAREENSRQMEDLKQAHEIQQRRAVEMAQIELRERHLGESQQLRDELNEFRQKLASSQRQLSRQEEEVGQERDRLRSMERDWRREKGQLQQKIEQLEAQLSLERRSNEFRVKEIESTVREKERDLISLQDKCVQLERDVKRTQNKYSLLEENGETKQKSLVKELETKKRELSDLLATKHAREEEYFEQCKRFNSEKSTLAEALESVRRSYDEKLAELKSSRELLALRQEQSYKERLLAQERLDDLGGQLLRMSEHKTQARLLEQQLQTNERQLESLRRECNQLKEDKIRLKARADNLESRCARYEKQELITKTSSISSSSGNLFLRAKNSLSPSASKETDRKYGSSAARAAAQQAPEQQQSTAGNSLNQQMIERLTSKINDQRHLINMLKEQYDSAQLELKQMKLVQSAERQKWQSVASQLQSRLNESEEKLLFETSLANQATFETCRRKFEIKWSEERKNTLDLMREQQAQIEGLMKDFKKVSQQHELLSLHTKQLEANNQKLSKKLIEYQNNQQQQGLFGHPGHSSPDDSGAERKLLSDCVAEKEQLLKQHSQLDQLNSSMLDLLRDQVRPLVETVNKIMTAIESPDGGNKQAPASGEELTIRRLSVSSRHGSADEGSKSTLRPLMTSKQQQVALADGSQPPHVGISATSSLPRHHQSRLSRLFGGSPAGSGGKSPVGANVADPNNDQRKQQSSSMATKGVKKVRVKSAALGITPSEKRQLKERLGELSRAIDQLSSSKAAYLRRSSGAGGPQPAPNRNHRLPHSLAAPAAAVAQDGAESSSTSTHISRVHWQLADADGSDLDSERSWSLQSESAQRPLTTTNIYRRFPQTTPTSHHRHHQLASLTDYESESSFAGSDISLCRPTASGLRAVSGVESDSCMASASSAAAAPGRSSSSTAARRRGLKMRFTDTLRNISRSITGLASDSESEQCAPAPKSRLKQKDARVSSRATQRNADDEVAKATTTTTTTTTRQSKENLKEIRV